MYAELNEEIEHIVQIAEEKLVPVDRSPAISVVVQDSPRQYCTCHLDEFNHSLDYFEIDSPPPERA